MNPEEQKRKCPWLYKSGYSNIRQQIIHKWVTIKSIKKQKPYRLKTNTSLGYFTYMPNMSSRTFLLPIDEHGPIFTQTKGWTSLWLLKSLHYVNKLSLNVLHLRNATQKAEQAQLGSIHKSTSEGRGGAAAPLCGQMQYCRWAQFIHGARFTKDAFIVALCKNKS